MIRFEFADVGTIIAPAELAADVLKPGSWLSTKEAFTGCDRTSSIASDGRRFHPMAFDEPGVAKIVQRGEPTFAFREIGTPGCLQGIARLAFGSS
jgi:hypothetical protein